MLTDEETRWSSKISYEIPKQKGVLNNVTKLDAGFFGIQSKQANQMDPQGRGVIEVAYEAILDAGIHPQSLRGSKMGVFVGICFSEAEKSILYENIDSNSSGLGLSG